jgi:hypothetical protein
MANRGRHKQKQKHLIVKILGEKIANRMMECQKDCCNSPNLDVFLKDPLAGSCWGGFIWKNTIEGHEFWKTIIDQLREHYLYKQYRNERS